MKFINDNLQSIVISLITGFILGSLLHLIDANEQEPALSRYCIDYCMKEYLKISSGEIDFYEVKRHCSEFYTNSSCCEDNGKYGECSIKTLKKLQQK